MKRTTLASVLILLVLAASLPAQSADWPDRELTQFIYAATLDGLQDLGLPDTAVDKILASDAQGRPVSFIPGCPVCQSVRDAFKAYRLQATRKTSREQAPELSADDALIRTAAVGRLVQTFVGRRVDAAGWTEVRRKEWAARMQRAEREGQRQLRRLQAEGVNTYKMMWTCKMCDAAAGACRKAR